MRISLLFFFFISTLTRAQQKFTISGYVKDVSNGEALIGGSILVKERGVGTTTNEYGFYSLTLPTDSIKLQYTYIGYLNVTKSLSLTGNVRLDIELTAEASQLEEVVITDKEDQPTATNMDMSTNNLTISTITKIPTFMGEADVLRSLLLLPGVSTVGEGASGFNVRGGSVGQNLVLLDEAPVYNSSHLFGFLSVFNPDAVKD